jgi:hypothetical protein
MLSFRQSYALAEEADSNDFPRAVEQRAMGKQPFLQVAPAAALARHHPSKAVELQVVSSAPRPSAAKRRPRARGSAAVPELAPSAGLYETRPPQRRVSAFDLRIGGARVSFARTGDLPQSRLSERPTTSSAVARLRYGRGAAVAAAIPPAGPAPL